MPQQQNALIPVKHFKERDRVKIKFESRKTPCKTVGGLRRLRCTAPSRFRRKSQNYEIVTQDVNLAQSQEDFPLEQTGWLGKNSDALALVKTGIAQAKEGKVKRMSFVDCADLEIDD